MKISARQERLLRRTFLDYQQTLDFLRSPLVIDRAEGLYYWDVAGRRYFDAIGGIFVAVLGHRHPRVLSAMQRQMDRVTFVPPLHSIADVTLDLIEKLGAVSPPGLQFVKPLSGGSEAVETAMKFARQFFKQTSHPGKYKFISSYLGYHGATFGAMAASGTGRRKAKFEPHLPGMLKVMPPIAMRDRYATWEETNRQCARSFEDVIVNEDAETVAGIIVEPISNTAGIQVPTREYFETLRKICDTHNVLLIFDEVITGFARTGRMFAAQTFGVTPDVICTGKGMSSGAMPLGAMIARTEMGEAFLGTAEEDVHFAHGHTFAGNPLGAAVACAVIDEIVEQRLDEKAQRLGLCLQTRLEGLRHLGVVGEVRGKGMLRGVELVEDPQAMRPFPAERKLGAALKQTALANGLIMRVDPDWFAVAPALIAEEADLDEMCGLIEKSLIDALKLIGG